MLWIKNALEMVYKNNGFWAAVVVAILIMVAVYVFGSDVFQWFS